MIGLCGSTVVSTELCDIPVFFPQFFSDLSHVVESCIGTWSIQLVVIFGFLVGPVEMVH